MAEMDAASWWITAAPRAEIDCRVRAEDVRLNQQRRWVADQASEHSEPAKPVSVLASDLQERTIDGLSLGVLLVGDNSRILILNSAAEALLQRGDGLRLKDGMLAATLPFETEMLQRVVANALQPAEPGAGPSYTVATVSRPSGAAPYLLLIARLEGRLNTGGGNERAVLIVIEDPELPNPNLLQQIRVAFQIADCGAEVAQQVIEGHGIGGTGESHGTKIRAVRALMSALMGESGIHPRGRR